MTTTDAAKQYANRNTWCAWCNARRGTPSQIGRPICEECAPRIEQQRIAGYEQQQAERARRERDRELGLR